MRRGTIAVALCAILAAAGCGSSASQSTTASTAANKASDGPAPTRRKPHVVVPPGPPPKRLVKRDLIVGSGATAHKGDEVDIQYVGALFATGSTFDSSSWRATYPLAFTLGDPGITVGWSRGIVGMRVGGRRELVIPPRFAYGHRRAGPVPPNSTLVYVIELIAIK
jgi:FKBP-type peptidyl-prolyl cis-trans isomerase